MQREEVTEQQMEEVAGPLLIERLQVSSCNTAVLVLGAFGRSSWVINLCRPQELGVAAADIKKLKEGGINTVDALAHAAKRELVAIKGLSEAKVEKIQKEGVASCCCQQLLCTRLTSLFYLR